MIGVGVMDHSIDNDAKQLIEARMTNVHSKDSFESEDKLQLRYTVGRGKVNLAWKGQPGDPIVLKENGEVKCLIGIASFNVIQNDDDDDYGNHTVFTSASIMKNWIWRQIKFLHKLQ